MADYKGLHVKFEGDSTSLSASLNDIARAASHAQGELRGIGKGLEQSPRSLDLMRDKVRETGNALDAAKGRVDQFRQGIDEAKRTQQTYRDALESGKGALKGYVESNIAAYQRNNQSIEDHKRAIESDKQSMELLEQAGQRGSDLWEQYAASIKQHEAAIEQATTANERMDAECEEAASALSELSGRVEEYDSVLAKMEQEVHKGEAAIEGWTRKLAEARAELKGTEFAESGIGQFANGLIANGNLLSGVGDRIWSVEKKILAVAGISAITFGRDMIHDVEEYGNSISQLGGYLEISGEKLEAMSDLALYWGKETQFSATEASSAMIELAKGGLTEAQIKGGAMEATMNLAAAGELGMADAAEVAVQAIKTFGLSAEDSARVADALAGAANKSTAEVNDLAQGFKYVGGWASLANWDINDVSGALALLADHGLRGEMAGTALRNVMQRLGAPTDVAKKLMSEYNLEVRDASGQMKSATEIVQELNDKLGGLGDEEKQGVLNKIFGARALPSAIALMDEGADALQEYIDATDKAGYATEMAQHRMSDMGWALEYLRGEAETASVNLGRVFEPLVTKGAKAIEGLLSEFNELTTEEQRNVVQTGLMVAAFAPALSMFGRLSVGAGKAILGVGGFVKGVSGLGKGVSATSRLTEGFATSIVSLGGSAATAMTGATAAVVALKAVAIGAGAALGAIAIGKFVWEMTDEMRALEANGRAVGDVLGGIHDNMDGFDADLRAGARAFEETGDAAKSAGENLSEYVESVKEHNKRNKETHDSAATTIAMLGQYKSVIEEMAGAGSASTEDMERLQWALDGLADATGETYTVEQVLTDQFLDEAGAAQNATQAISDLIEMKQAEARLDAIKSMYTDTLKEQIEAERSLDKLKQSQASAQERYNETYQKYVEAGYDAGMAAQYAEQVSHLQEANEALWQGQGLYNSLTEEAHAYEVAMGDAAREEYELEKSHAEASANMKAAWSSASESMKADMGDLKAALEEGGASSERLSEIGAVAFATLAAEADGDVGTLIQLIADYNAADFEEKHAGFHFEDGELRDANGMRVEWNDGEWQYKDTGVRVNVEQIPEAEQKIADVEASKSRMRDTDTKVNASGVVITGAAKIAIDDAKNAEDRLYNKDVSVNVYTRGTESLWDAIRAANSLVSKNVTYMVTTVNETINKKANAAGGIRPHADGGIHYHADGAIAAKAVPLDIVGEDGAEAIVPLTNRRYAQPFVDMISEGIAGIMPSAGNTYVIDGMTYLPGSEVARHVDAIFVEATRKARM